MKFFITVLLAFVFVYGSNKAPKTPVDIKAFVNVNVIPMDVETVLKDHTVIVENDKITSIGPSSKIKIPGSAEIIDGKGKYLLPGLMDMHIHLEEKDMLLYLLNGVTAVRNLNGNETHLELKRRVNANQLIGPAIFTSGPLITDSTTPWKIKVIPKTPEEARSIVAQQKKAGYDFVKVYNGLTKEIYNALMDEATIQNMPAVGHIPEKVGMQGVLDKKQVTIEHAEQIIYAFFGHNLQKEKIPEAVEMIKKAGTWVCPTLAVQEIFKLNRRGEFFPMLNNPEMKYVDPGIMGWWKSFARQKKDNGANNQTGKTDDFYEFQLALTKALFDAGIPIIAGTDNPNPGMVAGFSLHEELRNLVAAGLSNYQALKAGTLNAAALLKIDQRAGRIKEGMIADLLLLNENPLQNIEATRQNAGVMIKGKWYSNHELNSMVEKEFKL